MPDDEDLMMVNGENAGPPRLVVDVLNEPDRVAFSAPADAAPRQVIFLDELYDVRGDKLYVRDDQGVMKVREAVSDFLASDGPDGV